MPYIPKKDVNEKPDSSNPGFAYLKLRELGSAARCAGDLNYIFCQIIADYLTVHRSNKSGNDTFNYQVLNDVLGALEGATGEFKRRILWPYEDQKIVQAANPSALYMNRPIDPFRAVAARAKGVLPGSPEKINMPEDSS